MLSQEQTLSCIPPPVMYPEDTSGSRTTRYVGGLIPTSNISIRTEDDSYVAITVRIFLVLNNLLGGLKILTALPLASTHPTILKAYMFLAHLAKDEPESPHPYILTGSRISL
ncbi:28237_t:CDS:2 [Dentiscutata erythropus]|uniref:28237_t:CDS:1 n=1 Tax=Dentiscutata erythropus TaxID=1348616 RepID=A0A9N9E704_9GLOM|nr:28237_t:CDS:2 [Dentiscutata erythropus]